MQTRHFRQKGRLAPQYKAIVAASVLLETLRGTMDEDQACAALREAISLHWTLLTAIQYLSGKEAMGALDALPNDWRQDGRNKGDLVSAVLLANDVCANFHPGGEPLSAGLLVSAFKRRQEL